MSKKQRPAAGGTADRAQAVHEQLNSATAPEKTKQISSVIATPRSSLQMPYGLWTEAGGAEVLFDRRYRPIVRRGPGGAGPAFEDPLNWIGWKTQRWFYNDATTRGPAFRQRLQQILHNFLNGEDVRQYLLPERATDWRRLRREVQS